MTEGEHTFTHKEGQHRATDATICQWTVDAWVNTSAVLAQLFNLDTEKEEFEGFQDEELTAKVSFTCLFYMFSTEQSWDMFEQR